MLMKRILSLVLFSVLLAVSTEAAPVREAPDFSWVDASGKPQSLKKFRGKPVVLLIAQSPRTRRFRAQIGQIHNSYQRLGALNAIFVAAFTQAPGRIKSNIPFALANDGPQVGALYNVQDYSIAIIGKDGNLDYITTKVLPDQRIIDVINNSFVLQENIRRE